MEHKIAYNIAQLNKEETISAQLRDDIHEHFEKYESAVNDYILNKIHRSKYPQSI